MAELDSALRQFDEEVEKALASEALLKVGGKDLFCKSWPTPLKDILEAIAKALGGAGAIIIGLAIRALQKYHDKHCKV
jgi:hypothetical protein